MVKPACLKSSVVRNNNHSYNKDINRNRYISLGNIIMLMYSIVGLD